MSLNGLIMKDLPPIENNPRNSEGSFITTSEGQILFIYSSFVGDKSNDDAPSNLVMITSDDNGNTWSEGKTILTSVQENAKNIMSVTLRIMEDNSIGLFYIRRNSATELKTYLRRSYDNGKTWGDATECIRPSGYYVLNNDRIIKTSTGRLIMPTAFHRNGLVSYEETGSKFDERGICVFFYSDDDGNTWFESDAKCTMPYNKHFNSGLQEPGIIELKNNVLWAWARTDAGYQYEMFSYDNGMSFTAAEPSRFSSCRSPLTMKRNPNDDSLVAVWNPIPNYIGRKIPTDTWTDGRTPLVLATSYDEGKTWSQPLVLEDDENSGYCYTAMHFIKDNILLGYCAGGKEDGNCLTRLRIRKISLDNINSLR